MKIIDKKINEIKNNQVLSPKFITKKKKDIALECNILVANFFLDSSNYFPITEEKFSFFEVFAWGDTLKYNNFYTENFIKNYQSKIKDFKVLEDVFVLGSSPNNNYYNNLIYFLPRIFFIKDTKIKLAIHRNSSNKFRNFIQLLCDRLKIKLQFIFLDNNFYKFNNSQIPEFLSKANVINILNSLNLSKKIKKQKIYITRNNNSFRNLINESDVIEKLKKLNFKIVDLKNLEIIDQINLFSNASCVVSATGSGLANIVFCKPETKIIEISPKYQYEYENHLKSRFSFIAKQLKLNYIKIEAEPIEINKNNIDSKNIIPKVMNESNYYKDLLIKINTLNTKLSF